MIKNSLDIILNKHAKFILNKKNSLKNNLKNIKRSKLFYTLKGLTVDISRNYIDNQILISVLDYVSSKNIKSKIRGLFLKKHKSSSENKYVSHLYERNHHRYNAKLYNKMFDCYDFIKDGKWKSYNNKKFKYIIHIGIGGSIVGSKAVSEALADYQDDLVKVHYVSSADISEIQAVLSQCNIDETLFIMASKSFKTKELHLNYEYILDCLSSLKDINKYKYNNFMAVTANKKEAILAGIKPNRILSFSNTIPGRFSLTSAISFSLLLEIGKKNYIDYFEGVKCMDIHFKTAPIDKNIPILLASLSVWNINYLDITSHCVSAYSHRLRLLFSYIQQIEMESNGKSVNNLNQPIEYTTSPFVFGLEGTESQHSFFQMAHQGKIKMMTDFVGVININSSKKSSHFLLANLIAQADLFFDGNFEKNLYKKINGGQPSNIVMIDKISPKNIGLLITLYEHKVIAEGFLWDINSFDQWGVEEGKKSSKKILKKIQSRTSLNKNIDIINLIKKKIKK